MTKRLRDWCAGIIAEILEVDIDKVLGAKLFCFIARFCCGCAYITSGGDTISTRKLRHGYLWEGYWKMIPTHGHPMGL